MEYKYARRMSYVTASEIRELLKLTEQPEVISFAGGLPAPELFPIEEIKAANNYVLDHNGEHALQYATTEGYQPLREWIAARMNAQLGTSFCHENILITHGSQQALDLSGKVFWMKEMWYCAKVLHILPPSVRSRHMDAALRRFPQMTAE